jgi:hypothetical protein
MIRRRRHCSAAAFWAGVKDHPCAQYSPVWSRDVWEYLGDVHYPMKYGRGALASALREIEARIATRGAESFVWLA